MLNVMRDYGSGDPYIGQVELVSCLLYTSFLDAYDYKNEMKKYNTDKFVVNCMKPRWRFPVYWTEEWDMKHTWHRDEMCRRDRGYSYGKSTCTVQWKLNDDNVWRVSDFDDPP